MPAKILHQLQGRDTFEIVKDQLAAILVLESANQMALAQTNALDPLDWEMRVYTDRSNPWDMFHGEERRLPPIVNVSFDTDTGGASFVHQQRRSATFNIDCYGYGCSQATADGHLPGDLQANEEAARCARLVRQTLLHATYLYLGLQGLVGKRELGSRTAFHPPSDERPVTHVAGFRLAVQIDFDEHSSENSFPELEQLVIAIKRDGDGRVLINADYDLTTV